MLTYLIADTTKQRALDHGLELTITNETQTRNPRDTETSSFVGIDVKIPEAIETGSSFVEFVANYCREVLDCKIDDIIWAGVVDPKNAAVTYSTEIPTGQWSDHHKGFIYLTKTSVLEEYMVESIDQALTDKVMERFSLEMQEYTAWCRDDVYSLEVVSIDNAYYDSEDCIFNVNDSIDNAMNTIIDNVINWINSDAKMLDIKIDFESSKVPSDMTAVHFFNQNFYKAFGTNLTFTEYSFNNKTATLEGKISINSLPKFLQLAANVHEKSQINLFKAVCIELTILASNSQLHPANDIDVMEILTCNTDYKEWPVSMLQALMGALIFHMPSFHLIHVSESEKEATA